jgi:hypothetical protein
MEIGSPNTNKMGFKPPAVFLPYKPGGCLKSCVFHPIPNAMIENVVLLYSLSRVGNPTYPMQDMGWSLKRTRLQVHRLKH